MGILTLETNKYALKLDNFEGPLDLLCHLIDKNKMDIYDVKLSEITDQYIEYINEMEKQNLDVTSEFLVIASTLLFLKSKELLPKETDDETEITEEARLENQISIKINEELDIVGVGRHLQGRKYFHDSIKYLILNPQDDGKASIIQILSNKYQKSSSTINRAMQNAIMYAWRITPVSELEKIYTAKVNYLTGVPTPTEFIYFYVNKIKKEI